MKFSEPRPNRSQRVRSSEVIGRPEGNKALQFNIHDFFTATEWDRLVETLTKFDYDEDEIVEFEARTLLHGALALRFLDQEKLDQLRNNTITKRTMKRYLRDTEQEKRPKDWQTLNAIAVWLWPELEQVEKIKLLVTRFRESAEKKTNRKTLDYLKAGDLALLYPDLKDRLGINQHWLQVTSEATNFADSDLNDYRDRYNLAKELFFTSDFSDEDSLQAKEWGEESSAAQRNLPTVKNLGDVLLLVAYVRLVLKQHVTYSNAGIQITDRHPLQPGPELPNRPQV